MPIRTWDRRRNVGPFRIRLRRDESGIQQRGLVLPRPGGGYPRFVVRIDHYGGQLHAMVVVGPFRATVTDEVLADDAADFAAGRRFAGYLWRIDHMYGESTV